jgi:hypothetical protein
MDDDEADGESEPATSASSTARRLPGRPFTPGSSGNPTGRPRTDARVRAALERLTPAAVAELKRLLKDERTPRRVRASIAMYVVDRRLGKPTISVGGADGQPLYSPGAPGGGDAVDRLMALVRRHKQPAADQQGQEPTPAENAPPGANGGTGRAPS